MDNSTLWVLMVFKNGDRSNIGYYSRNQIVGWWWEADAFAVLNEAKAMSAFLLVTLGDNVTQVEPKAILLDYYHRVALAVTNNDVL